MLEINIYVTEGMVRLWENKFNLFLCILIGVMVSSKALFIWVIIISFILLFTKLDIIKTVIISFIINFCLVFFTPEIYV